MSGYAGKPGLEVIPCQCQLDYEFAEKMLLSFARVVRGGSINFHTFSPKIN